MTAFRIYNPFPVYLDSQGNLAVAGYLQFYQSGTTTPKDVYGDPGLTVNNGSQVSIGTDGRTVNDLGMPIDIWGDGNYRVRLYASDNTLVAERDNVQLPGGSGTAIPALQAGKFLTSDGSVLQWDDVLQVPDPTGMSGKLLGTDGVSLIWQSVASLNIPSYSSGASSVTIGGLKIQWGSGTAPASGFRQIGYSVNFVESFSSTPYIVLVVPTTVTATVGLQIAVPAITSKSQTGFSVQFDSDDFGQTNAIFSNPVTFDYVALGPK